MVLVVKFGTARLLGLIGSVFMVASIVLPLLAIIGLILIVYSLYNLSKIYGDKSISRNAKLFVIFALIGIAILFIGIGSIHIIFSNSSDSLNPAGALLGAVFAVIIMIALIIIEIISGIAVTIGLYFLYKSLSRLSEVSSEGLFKTSGLTLLGGYVIFIIGLLASIILSGYLISPYILVGGIVILWGFILLAIAFHRIKPPQMEI
ncbi:MAG: DUF996 domain-containing protein [Acidilobaceae archaeon]